jgi:hypothetical protein
MRAHPPAVGGGWRQGLVGLNTAMWRHPIGTLCRFLEDWQQLTPWLPPINMRGGGVRMETHTSSETQHTFLL